MSGQTIPIHTKTSIPTENDLFSFDAFNFAPGQDQNIRWLSRPNEKFFSEILSKDAEKFRVQFDAENFRPEQIKIYILNQQLTITGIYEERSEGRHVQKQFEKSFDIPQNANIDAMAAYLTPNHMLLVEIPLISAEQSKSNFLNINKTNQRRLSFSLGKYNDANNPNSLIKTDETMSLAAPHDNHKIRRTSITKTITTTTTVPSSTIEPKNRAAQQNSLKTTGEQIVINEPQAATTINSNNLMDLSKLGIELPPELLKLGGTITIQKRRVSVTRTGADPNVNRMVEENEQSFPPTINNQRRSSTTILTNNEQKIFTLEEFLQNKIWNPSIVDGSNGKKILQMRLEMKPGTTADQLRVTLNGHNLRVEIKEKNQSENLSTSNGQSYRQITLFPTCDITQLNTVLKADGFLHIQVPIIL